MQGAILKHAARQMDDEIDRRYFDAEDFSTFRTRLNAETEMLRSLFDAGDFSTRGDVAGLELETWLVDHDGNPLPQNQSFLAALDNPLVVPELAAYNVELNGSPTALRGRVFSRLADELNATWDACRDTADTEGCQLVRSVSCRPFGKRTSSRLSCPGWFGISL